MRASESVPACRQIIIIITTSDDNLYHASLHIHSSTIYPRTVHNPSFPFLPTCETDCAPHAHMSKLIFNPRSHTKERKRKEKHQSETQSKSLPQTVPRPLLVEESPKKTKCSNSSAPRYQVQRNPRYLGPALNNARPIPFPKAGRIRGEL